MSTEHRGNFEWRPPTGWTVLVAALVASGIACSDSDPAGPCPSGDNRCDPPPSTPSPFVVSDPVLGPATAGASATVARVDGPEGDAAVVYVSLAAGEIPGGTSATIENLGTGAMVTTPMVAGGFDPVAVEASAGDSLEVEVSARPNLLRFRLRVPATAPPIVVRTEPTTGKRDVPLNARIIIVFSEPIDGATLTGATVQLKQGLIVVAGTVQFADAELLTAEFVPDEALAPQTDYELVITQEIKDRDGEPLETAVGATFTTSSASANRLVFTVQPSAAVEGSPMSPAVEVTVQDALGNTVTDFADSVTLSPGENTMAGTLAGTVRVAAIQGVATFGDLWLIGGELGWTLVATAPGLSSQESAFFGVGRDTLTAGLDSIRVRILDAESQALVQLPALPQILAAPISEPAHQRRVAAWFDGSATVGLLSAGTWAIAVSVIHGATVVFPGLQLYSDTMLTVEVIAGETTVLPDLLLRPRAPLLLIGVNSCPWALPDPPTEADWGDCDSGYWGGVDVRIEVTGVNGTSTEGLRFEAAIGPAQSTSWTSWDDNPWSTYFDVPIPGDYDVRLVEVAPSSSGWTWELVPWETASRRVRVESGLGYTGFAFWHK